MAGKINLDSAKAETTGAGQPVGRHGLRINIVAPGTVDTRNPRRDGRPLSEEKREAISETTALGKVAEADDVARALVSVACDLTHMTGQTLVIDGGQLPTGH